MTRKLRANKLTNQLQSILLVLCMGLFMVAIGWLLLGTIGIFLAIAISIYNLVFGPTVSPRAILRAYHAQPLTPYEAPQLIELFSALIERADLSHPVQLWYVPSQVPNAFAVGSGSNASVAVTDGLLRLMNERELAGVLAHEVAHVMHKDTTVMGIADTMGRIASGIARLGLLVLFLGLPTLISDASVAWTFLAGCMMMSTPFAVFLLQMALSRSREFNADLGAVSLTNDPLGLASALQKLEQLQQGGWFGRIFKNKGFNIEPSWIRSHPATKDRVRELEEIAASIVEETSSTLKSEPTMKSKPVSVDFHAASCHQGRRSAKLGSSGQVSQHCGDRSDE